MKLTEAQRALLTALTEGGGIVYSQDGDYGWLTDPKRSLDDFGISNGELQDLRDRRFIGWSDSELDFVRFDPPEVITPSGRAALEARRQP